MKNFIFPDLCACWGTQMGADMKYYMGMDIGGTSARLKIACEGKGPREYVTKGCTLSTSGYEGARLCYEEAVLPVLREQGLKTGDCAGLCIAASGVDSPAQEEECRRIFIEMGFPQEVIAVYNDCEIFLWLSEEPSLVLVAGTGSIAVGKSADGRIVRSGGWGHILSDEGSAMDIGKRVLRAVGDHMDGRKCCPILYRMFEKQLKITSLAQLDIYVTENIMDKPRIACFAPLAEQAAREGEEAAQEILEECADALFALVRDTFRKASDVSGKPRNLYLWGSVLTQNKEIEMRLRKKCKEAFPALKVDFPGISALELALSLASGTW